MKKWFFCLLLLQVSLINSQKLQFNIANDTINNKLLITSVNDEVLETIVIKEDKFEVTSLNLESGYYLLKKNDNPVVLYLKKDDDLTISYDASNFYKSIIFTGKGSDRNSYLLSKQTDLLNNKGRLTHFYKKKFYSGSEQDYVKRLDAYYKDRFGSLFSSRLGKDFENEEMKDLQYAYSLDLLKFADAKKKYDFLDSVTPSRSLTEPLTYIHFDNQQLYDKYPSYKALSILKWKKDIEKEESYLMMEDIFGGIRNKNLQQAVLESLYESLSKEDLQQSKKYYKLIKNNASTLTLLSKAKAKYDVIRQVEAEKNLSNFKYIDTDGLSVQLSEYTGKYIVVNVWSTICKNCSKDFEKIAKYKDKYKGYNIEFVSIALDKKDKFDTWLSILKENNIEENQLFFDGSKSKFINAYDVKSIPSFLLISLKGEVINDEKTRSSLKKTMKVLDGIINAL